MSHDAGKLLVVESDNALRELIVSVLKDAGYEVSTNYREGMRSVLAFGPDLVVLGADPPQLDCCDLLSEIKGSENTQNIRVIMLSPGGPADRARGMDLGADDVLSLPFDPHELLSRIRAQLRDKHLVDQLRRAEESQKATQQVVAAVNEERRTVRVRSWVALAIVIIAGLAFALFYRRTQQQNTRVYTAITRLQSGLLTQEQLMEHSRRALENANGSSSQPSDPQRVLLQKKSEELRSQIASGKTADAGALQSQLAAVEGRLQRLETEGKVAQTIIQSYEPSVCLIHVVIGFHDHITGLSLRYAGLTNTGEPTTDDHNNPLVGLTGLGPEVRIDVFGTGFLASGSGEILTNHHVAEPWWQNDELKEMTDQGLDPVISEMMAYFPGVRHGIPINIEKISSAVDVAVVKGNLS